MEKILAIWNYLLPSRYESKGMLKNYIVAQYGPYLETPENTSEDYYRSIINTAGKYLETGNYALDIGCATGRLVFEYEKFGAVCYGIDKSKTFISFCNQIKQNETNVPYRVSSSATFIQGDILLTPFKTLFNFVSCVNIIDRVTNPITLINKTYKLLVPRGVALFVDPYDWEFSPAPKNIHIYDMKKLFDFRVWNLLEETSIPFTIRIGNKIRRYNCHSVVVQKI